MIGMPSVKRFGFFPAVRFDDADNDLASLRLLLPRGLQHGVGLAHARGHAEENLQLAARSSSFLALYLRENLIRIRPIGLAHISIVRPELKK